MKVLITGGTGFVGRHLIALLNEHSCQCVITTRNAQRAKQQLGSQVVDVIEWKATTEALDLSTHPDLRAVINLAGDPIDGRWTEKKKKKILASRVTGTSRLVDAVRNQSHPPEVFVSASAVGYYGESGDSVVNEQSPSGSGFLPDVCKQWESAAAGLDETGIRKVIMRIGIVLGTDGGALKTMVPIFRWGLGGRIGNGKQFMPWIHVRDLCRLILMTVENKSCSGPYNGTAPEPVRNSKFTKSLSRVLNRPSLLPVPGFALRLVKGEFAGALLWSQRVMPDAALRDGFEFDFANLDAALTDLLQQNNSDF